MYRVESIKRTGTALAMILGPFLLAVGFFIHPLDKSTGAAELQMIVDNIGRWNLAHLLLLVGAVFFIPAVLGLMQLLRERGAWFGLIGGWLAGIGVVFFGALIGVDALATSALADLPAAQRAALAPAVQAFLDMRGASVAGNVGFLLIVGIIVLAIGLFVTRAVPRWASAAIVIGSLLEFGFSSSSTQLVGTAGTVVVFFGMAAIGLREVNTSGSTFTPDRVSAGAQLAHET